MIHWICISYNFSYTFTEVQQESNFYWNRLQVKFLEEYSIKSTFPVHLQVIALPFFALHAILWCLGRCCQRKQNNKVDTEKEKAPTENIDNLSKRALPTFVRGNESSVSLM